MRPDELQAILSQTLDDYRLSRSERKALTSRLKSVQLDESDQTLCHSIAFQLARETIDPVNSSRVLEWLEDVSKVLRRSAAPPAPATSVETQRALSDRAKPKSQTFTSTSACSCKFRIVRQ